MKRRFFSLIIWGLLLSSNLAFAQNKNDVFKIVYADSWFPISYIENQEAKGILPELMEKLLSDGLNVQVKHIAVPWGRAQEMIKNGYADAFITTVTKDRLSYSYASEETVYKLPFVAAIKKNSPIRTRLEDPDNLQDFSSKTFCDVLGNGWADAFYKDKPVRVHIVPTIKECLKLLDVGRVDAIVHAKPVLEHYTKEIGLESSIVILDSPSVRSPDFALLLSKKSRFGQDFLLNFDHFMEENKD